VKSIQVKHSGELGREYRERERDVADWGERERTEMLRENPNLNQIKSFSGFLTFPKPHFHLN
jgi:hypothetical protein